MHYVGGWCHTYTMNTNKIDLLSLLPARADGLTYDDLTGVYNVDPVEPDEVVEHDHAREWAGNGRITFFGN